jgi:hypothetical protein
MMSGVPVKVAAALRMWCRLDPVCPEADLGLTDSEWDYLLEFARNEEITGFLHRSLSVQQKAFSVPKTISSAFRSGAMAQASRAARSELEIAGIIAMLKTAGLRPLLIRGQALVSDIYKDGYLRPHLDHDLLFESHEVQKAGELLTEQGYLQARGGGPYFRGASIIDIHDDPYGRGRVAARALVMSATTERIFWRATKSSVGGEDVLRMSAEDRLLCLSAHAIKHSFDKLIRLVDIAECWKKGDVDKDVLADRAETEGSADALFYALAAAKLRLGADVPASFLARIDPGKRRMVDWSFRRIMDGHPAPYFAEWVLLSQLQGVRTRSAAVRDMLWPAELKSRTSARGLVFALAWTPFRLMSMTTKAIAGTAGSILRKSAGTY